MKKTIRFVGMALMATALCFGINSCGNDEDEYDFGPMPEVTPQEGRTQNGTNGFEWKKSVASAVPGRLVLDDAKGEVVVLQCYPVGDKHPVDLSTIDVTLDYDKNYIVAGFERISANNHQLLVFGVGVTSKPTNLTIVFKVKGKLYRTIIPVTVLGKTEFESDSERRLALKKYWESERSSQTPMDLTPINATKLPDYIETANGLMMLTKKDEDVLKDVNNFRPVENTNIYPGSIIYINEGLENGKPEPVKFVGEDTQGTVTVNLTFLAGAGNKTSIHNVKNESGEIRAAINTLMAQVFGSGMKVTPPADIAPNISISNSVQKLAYDLDVSASYLGAKCGMNLSESNTSTKIYRMETFNQSFYSIEVTPENGDDTNYLGKDVTVDNFKAAEQAGGKIGIIKAVYYGRFGYFKKEYESSKMTLVANESASYKDYVSASSSQDIDKFCETTNQSGKVYGGSAKVAGDALKSEDAFMKSMLSSTEVSYSNQGEPIYYVVEYLGTSKPATAKQSGRLSNVTEYLPCPNYLYIEVRNHCSSMYLGSKVFLDLYYDTFKLVNGKPVDVQTGVKTNVQMTETGKTYYDGLDEPLPKGEYMKAKCRFEITYNNISGNTFYTTDKGYFDISDGQLVVCIEGSTYPGAKHAPYLNYICGGKKNVDMPIGWTDPDK